MGTALSISQAQQQIVAKAAVHGVQGETVDGMDVLAVEAAVRRASDAVRTGAGPQFLELHTYRFRGHSMADPELYRTKEEVKEWRKRDPISLFRERLTEWELINEPTVKELENSVDAEIEEAVAEAEAGSWEPVEDVLKDVTSG
jgi:TPP-dependent pyruvate/acetoin dehydrogenase alpha subunit